MLKNNWPIFVCTLAIVVTMIGCTWWAEHELQSAIPDVENYNEKLDGISSQLGSIESDTDWIHRRIVDKTR